MRKYSMHIDMLEPMSYVSQGSLKSIMMNAPMCAGVCYEITIVMYCTICKTLKQPGTHCRLLSSPYTCEHRVANSTLPARLDRPITPLTTTITHRKTALWA